MIHLLVDVEACCGGGLGWGGAGPPITLHDPQMNLTCEADQVRPINMAEIGLL